MSCVILLEGTAAGVPTEFDGKFVKAYDPRYVDADWGYDGGILEVTSDPQEALRFASAAQALLKYSESYGWREDGEPNRPLRAWTIQIVPFPEEEVKRVSLQLENDRTGLRPELTSLPLRMRLLPVHRGYPVPWFVAWIDGEPEFRGMDARKWVRAVKERRCWVCGQPLGTYLTFVLGPMCLVNFTSSEPPSHHECATWSARNCPFLTRPNMVRREAGLPEEMEQPGGLPILRNPGVTALWTTRSYQIFRDPAGKPLIQVSDQLEHLEWWAEGRAATREEVRHSVETGLPILAAVAAQDGPEAVAEMAQRVAAVEALYPAE